MQNTENSLKNEFLCICRTNTLAVLATVIALQPSTYIFNSNIMSNKNQGSLINFNSNSGQATYLFNVNQVTPDVVDYVNSHIEWYQSQQRIPFAQVSPDGLTFTHRTLDASSDTCTIEIVQSAKGSYAKFHNVLTQAERLELQAKRQKPKPFKGLKPLSLVSQQPAQEQSESAQQPEPATQEFSAADADLAGTEPEAFS
jgi:hypothetical protein